MGNPESTQRAKMPKAPFSNSRHRAGSLGGTIRSELVHFIWSVAGYLGVPSSCLIRLQDLQELHATVNGDTKQEANLQQDALERANA